jgi:hypothetical protein
MKTTLEQVSISHHWAKHPLFRYQIDHHRARAIFYASLWFYFRPSGSKWLRTAFEHQEHGLACALRCGS